MATERDISFARARALVDAHALRMAPEPVPVGGAEGRRLAEDVRMLTDHPPFTNSAMDGWAVRAADGTGPRRVVGESAAGAPWHGAIQPGEAVRVSTGAAMPAGADAVVPVEVADESGDTLAVREAPGAGVFVRTRGGDAAAGDLLITRGTRLSGHHLAAAAGAGHPFLACARRPRVAVVVSGDEVMPVGAPLGPGQVWDVNGTALPALVRAAGADPVSCVHVGDDREQTVRAVRAAVQSADAVFTSGGVSMGPHDHLRPALAQVDAAEVFWGVGIRPGHPLWLGTVGDVPVLALPGNPVSAVVCFLVFGRALLGCADPWVTLPLAAEWRPQTPRTDLIRCTLTDGGLAPATRQSSQDITSLAAATHIAAVPPGSDTLRRGDAVPALALPNGA